MRTTRFTPGIWWNLPLRWTVDRRPGNNSGSTATTRFLALIAKTGVDLRVPPNPLSSRTRVGWCVRSFNPWCWQATLAEQVGTVEKEHRTCPLGYAGGTR